LDEAHFETNRKLWDALTEINAASEFYNVVGFKAGENRFDEIEREGVGDIDGKSVLHLQCHFGMTTLSFAREGAQVTGVDFSPKAMALARSLSEETGIPGRFIETNIYELPNVLDEQFDVVFTSYGVLGWLPDIDRWGQIVGRYLKPGGRFFIAEGHPFAFVFDENGDQEPVKYPYFLKEAIFDDDDAAYADEEAKLAYSESYEWQHTMSSIINALLKAGLVIEEMQEYNFCVWKMYEFMVETKKGERYDMPPGRENDLPLMFSLRASKPAS